MCAWYVPSSRESDSSTPYCWEVDERNSSDLEKPIGGLVENFKGTVSDLKVILNGPSKPSIESPHPGTQSTHGMIIDDLTKFVVGKLLRPWRRFKTKKIRKRQYIFFPVTTIKFSLTFVHQQKKPIVIPIFWIPEPVQASSENVTCLRGWKQW